MPVRYLYRLWTGGTVGTVIEIVIRIICVTKFTEMYYKIYVFQQQPLVIFTSMRRLYKRVPRSKNEGFCETWKNLNVIAWWVYKFPIDLNQNIEWSINNEKIDFKYFCCCIAPIWIRRGCEENHHFVKHAINRRRFTATTTVRYWQTSLTVLDILKCRSSSVGECLSSRYCPEM